LVEHENEPKSAVARRAIDAWRAVRAALSSRRSLIGGARRVGLVLGFAAALATFALKVEKHSPVQEWFVWTYLRYWLCALGLIASCLSAGFLVTNYLLRRAPVSERVYFAVPAGVLVWFWCAFVAGRLSLLGPAFGVIAPLALFASGAQPLYQVIRRSFGHFRAAHRRRPALSPVEIVAVTLGLIGLTVVYVGILTPNNAAYDSRWYHLPLAEHYAAAGAIERSPEGWFQAALPHLSSLLYLWPFLFSGFRLFDQVEIAAHFEFVLFLWTLAGIPLLVRWLVPGARTRTTWAVMFLFPALFSYDSCLSIAADHIAALWAIPIFLALRRAWRSLEPRASALLGTMLAGAIVTKYQAISIVLFPVLAIAARLLWLVGKSLLAKNRGPERWRFALGAGVAGATTLGLSSAHWLKNWIWYGDPIYPALHQHLTVRPWNVDGPENYRTQTGPELWQPQGTTVQKLEETTRALFTFSFEPHDWYQFHRDWPIFGFLFTLSLFLIPFVRASRRVWALFLAGNVAIFTWYWTTHQDRYLQISTPWLVCEVAAILILCWRSGALGRAGILVLTGLQVIWAAGVVLIPSHSFTTSSFKAAWDLVGSGFDRARWPNRFETFTDWAKAGKSTPKNAKLLVHHEDVHAGLRRQSVSDSAMWQGLINYGRKASQSEVHRELLNLGVTHVLWIEGDTIMRYSLASDLRFSWLIVNHVQDEKTFGGIHVARLPHKIPADRKHERVLYLACTGYTPGIYDLDQLVVIGRNPPPNISYPKPTVPLANKSPTALNRALSDVDYAVVNPTCEDKPTLPEPGNKAFVSRYHRGPDQLWVRRIRN
jgi:hypothetical protein